MACADEKTCLAVCQNKVGCSNIAYPKLVMELLPLGKCKYKTGYYLKMDLLIFGFLVLFCLSLEDTGELYQQEIMETYRIPPVRVNTGRPSARNHANLQDFPFRGYQQEFM